MQDSPVQALNAKSEASPGAGLLFLREEEFRIAQDTMFFAMRDLTTAPDAILA